MSVLIIGGDRVEPIKDTLNSVGVDCITHWDIRKKRKSFKSIPDKVDCLVLLTNFLDHNAMKYYKSRAKKKKLPIVCSKRSTHCLLDEWDKTFNK